MLWFILHTNSTAILLKRLNFRLFPKHLILFSLKQNPFSFYTHFFFGLPNTQLNHVITRTRTTGMNRLKFKNNWPLRKRTARGGSRGEEGIRSWPQGEAFNVQGTLVGVFSQDSGARELKRRSGKSADGPASGRLSLPTGSFYLLIYSQRG